MIDKKKDEDFYAKAESKPFNFSYSSLNKISFSPSLFYKEYILQDREIKTDKHLIEGKLIHCLLFEPENLSEKFNVVPGKAPSDNIRKVMKDMALHTDEVDLDKIEDFVILDSLKEMNLYQSLKTDEQRIAKIKVDDFKPYWKFLNNPVIDVVDQDTLEKCKKKLEILKGNKEVMDLFSNVNEATDFELDVKPTETYAEKYLNSKLTNYNFGLHGYIDYFKIDYSKKEVIICDLKTTGKSISEFVETIDFYNYWLQAAIYYKLVLDFLSENSLDNAQIKKILFKFVVIDTYNQVYVFDVTESTMESWAQGLKIELDQADYHYSNKNYNLPYDFLIRKVVL